MDRIEEVAAVHKLEVSDIGQPGHIAVVAAQKRQVGSVEP